MSAAVTVVSALLLALILAQLCSGVPFVRALLGRRPEPPEDPECPPALVVLPLRGADETLSRCLTALIRQDYPRFDVRVVVDGPNDPAWEVVREVLDEHPAPNVRVEALRDPRETCSLKCSSLLQGVEGLEPEHAFVAGIDADVVPHATWLRELAGGFDDPSVGAVTGHRWYLPGDASWGGLVRWLWNLAVVPQMFLYGIPWGGTLAVRADLLDSAGIRERWSRALSEDTSLTSALRDAGERLRFVPSLLMVDRSSCELADLERWIRRQLVCARLHHPGWPLASAHGYAVSAALLLVILTGLAALLVGDAAAARRALGAILAWEALMLAGAALLVWSVRRRLRRRGEDVGWPSLGVLLRAPLALPLTQALGARALLGASRARSVRWRGVRYTVGDGGRVRKVDAPGDRGARSRAPRKSRRRAHRG